MASSPPSLVGLVRLTLLPIWLMDIILFSILIFNVFYIREHGDDADRDRRRDRSGCHRMVRLGQVWRRPLPQELLLYYLFSIHFFVFYSITDPILELRPKK